MNHNLKTNKAMTFRLQILVRVFTLLIVVSSSCILAQGKYKHSFKEYSKFCKDNSGIQFRPIRGFEDNLLIEPEIYYVSAVPHTPAYAYWVSLQSKDKECLIFYPALFFNTVSDAVSTHHIFNAYDFMLGEIGAALGLQQANGYDSANLDISAMTSHFKEIPQSEAQKLFNADCAYIAHIPNAKPYDEKYTHCVGLYIGKKNRPAIFVKVFLTENGLLKEQEYIDALLHSIKYCRGDWTFEPSRFTKNQEKYLQKIKTNFK